MLAGRSLRSDEIGELVMALAKAKLEFTDIEKNGYNPFLKYPYPTLNDVERATVPALSKNGLVVVHQPEEIEVRPGEMRKILISTLIHSSGQYMECRIMFDAIEEIDRGLSRTQMYGKENTYLRRYATCNLLNVTADEDTDGARGDGKTPNIKGKLQDTKTKSEGTDQKAQDKNQEQPKDALTRAREAAFAYVGECGVDTDSFKDWCHNEYGVKSTNDMDTVQWTAARTALKTAMSRESEMLDGQKVTLNKLLEALEYEDPTDPRLIANIEKMSAFKHIKLIDASMLDPKMGAQLISLLKKAKEMKKTKKENGEFSDAGAEGNGKPEPEDERKKATDKTLETALRRVAALKTAEELEGALAKTLAMKDGDLRSKILAALATRGKELEKAAKSSEKPEDAEENGESAEESEENGESAEESEENGESAEESEEKPDSGDGDSGPSEEEKLFIQLRELLESYQYDKSWIDKRMKGLEHAPAQALLVAIEKEKRDYAATEKGKA